VRNEDGRKITPRLHRDHGHKLVSADYSTQIACGAREIDDIPVLKQASRRARHSRHEGPEM